MKSGIETRQKCFSMRKISVFFETGIEIVKICLRKKEEKRRKEKEGEEKGGKEREEKRWGGEGG